MPQREPPSTTPLSDACKIFTNSSHSLTKDDIPVMVDVAIRALPNTSVSQENTPTGLSSELQHEDSSTEAQAPIDTQQRDHLPPPGEDFNCLWLYQ